MNSSVLVSLLVALSLTLIFTSVLIPRAKGAVRIALWFIWAVSVSIAAGLYYYAYDEKGFFQGAGSVVLFVIFVIVVLFAAYAFYATFFGDEPEDSAETHDDVNEVRDPNGLLETDGDARHAAETAPEQREERPVSGVLS